LTEIHFINPIQLQIQQVEERMRSHSNGYSAELNGAIEHLLTSGGKRLRPAVALLTGEMLGGDSERLVALGAAIELLHTATLVHDDLIDGSLMRRGNATLNAKWSPAATVLTGDFIFAQAAELAAETESVILMKKFAKTLATIVSGELAQLFSSSIVTSRSEYYQRIYAKTASLFELAAEAAAHLSPVDGSVIEAFRQFGYDLGMAFQIVDDVLDFTGEQTTIGKPVASDLRQGLVTLPTLIYMEISPDQPDINKIIQRKVHEIENLDALISLIRESGAIDQAMEEAKKYIDKALHTLANQPPSAERNALEELAGYIICRSL
jgi:geranylgeranyl pyrophosphate synthase